MTTEEDLYHLAKDIDARVAAVEQAAKTGETLPLVQPIGTGLGTVTVDGLGGLVSVDLDRDAIGAQTGASLAKHVLRAITTAESAATTRRKAMVDDAARETR